MVDTLSKKLNFSKEENRGLSIILSPGAIVRASRDAAQLQR
jgi:hypothetical protein